MATSRLRFTFITGLPGTPFTNARLKGSWDAAGRYSEHWTEHSMAAITGPDGCAAFTQTVDLDAQDGGTEFAWGVELDGPAGARQWAVLTEESRDDSTARVRRFTLHPGGGSEERHEVYYFHYGRRFGAQKYFAPGSHRPAIQFSVWAPNASAVEVCIGNLWHAKDASRTSLIHPDNATGGRRALESRPRGEMSGGYIDPADADHPWGPFQLHPIGGGVWATDPADPELAEFSRFDHVPYMFRITTRSGNRRYRTDLYSRCQIGYGATRPSGPYTDLTTDLDGSVSCSVVVDPDQVTAQFLEPVWPEMDWTPQDEFFALPAPRPVTVNPQDLVIYELHIGALGAGRRRPNEAGTLEDVIALLNHLEELGVNAVELLPLSEFGGGGAGWGYATSHYFAVEYAGGGRDQYKWFIRECHRRGIAVILDVVYNHYNHEAERAEWMFDVDDNDHERNAYYWYEGRSGDYPAHLHIEAHDNWNHPPSCGGYVDNESTAWAPRYWEEMVRGMFVSSAVVLASEFKVDGFRVDQTTSIRSYNKLHADGRRALPHVNAFGAKLLRELTRSLRFLSPSIMLFAEDHDNWDGVSQPPEEGGLGFDAGWYADFYHHLIGDTDKPSNYAKLLKTAGLGDDRALAMNSFAGALQASGGRRVVYHESHDEAGNGKLTDRTINVAVDGAPLVGETRRYAEARCRFAAGVTLLSAGIPMFLFGEEVGARKKFIYNEVLANREELETLRHTTGAHLFEFYRALIRLRRAHPGLRSRDIDVVFVHNEHRLLVFRRWGGGEDFLVIAGLNNQPFSHPSYRFVADRIPAGAWREIFNSDAAMFGGWNVGNGGATFHLSGGALECVVPANGVLVLEKVNA